MSPHPILINSVCFWTIKTDLYTLQGDLLFPARQYVRLLHVALQCYCLCWETVFLWMSLDTSWYIYMIYCFTFRLFLLFFFITSSVVHSPVFMLLHCIYLNRNCWVVHHTHVELYWVMPIFFFPRVIVPIYTPPTGQAYLILLCSASLHLGHMAFSFFFSNWRFVVSNCQIMVSIYVLSNNG